MEHPIFSLSTKPDTRVRRYEHRGLTIEIKPSSDGLATVHDRDILIFCISQLIRGINDGREPSQTIRFQASDLLRATNRMTTGRGYELLKGAMERLAGTRISTNIATGGQEIFETFGLIERARIVRQTRQGRMLEVEVKLSDWVFNAIRAKEVLTISRDYFRLRRPLERRLYELARKHCGTQNEWTIGLELLQKKCGSNSTSFEFKRLITNIVDEDISHSHIPDYAIRFSPDERQLVFTSRGTAPAPVPLPDVFEGHVADDDYGSAREVAPGWDVRYLEQEWRRWCASEEIFGLEPLHDALDGAGGNCPTPPSSPAGRPPPRADCGPGLPRR
jgi:hypothetical protein